MPPLAHFLTFHTYGTYLHGHENGSVDRNHNIPGTAFLAASPAREAFRRQQLAHPPTELDQHARFVVDATIRGVCDHRQWHLYALHVRTNHVHVVLAATDPADKVLVDLKAWCTRRLRESALVAATANVWAHHGSTRCVDSEDSLARAIHYTTNEQGPPLPMSPPPGGNRGTKSSS